jgi:exodeoxyribonuclease V gamma subunit
MSRPGFVVLHGNRLEDLRELLVEHVRAHPPPPLGEDLILVQSNGMRHWLELGLADDRGGLGICAGVRMELPAAFLWQAARAVLGEAAVPRRLPLDEEPLVWRLMRLLPHLPRPISIPFGPPMFRNQPRPAIKMRVWRAPRRALGPTSTPS